MGRWLWLNGHPITQRNELDLRFAGFHCVEGVVPRLLDGSTTGKDSMISEENHLKSAKRKSLEVISEHQTLREGHQMVIDRNITIIQYQ